MDVILGQIFGLFILTVGLGMLVNPELFLEAFNDIAKHAGVRMMSALFPVFIGAVIVPLYPMVVWNWTLSLTILGYGLLILGTIRYLFIKHWVKVMSPIVSCRYFQVLGTFLVLYGGFMLYHAFPMIAILVSGYLM